MRKDYDAEGSSFKSVITQIKRKSKVYAVGHNGQKFIGITLKANKFLKPMKGLKVWTSVMDAKTCDSCKSMDGQTVGITDFFTFVSDKKTYKLDAPPLHGFNQDGDKKTTFAIPFTEKDNLGRFEEPTCRCMAIYISQETSEEEHYSDYDAEVVVLPDEVVETDRFLLEAVYPIDALYYELGKEAIPFETYISIAEHYEINYKQIEDLAQRLKENGIIETLKLENYI